VFQAMSDLGTGSKRDLILDFESGLDKIDLSLIGANTQLSGNNTFTFIGSKGWSGQGGEVRAFFNGSNTIVEGNINDDKKLDFQIGLNGNIALTAADFLL
jgi:serralysin